VACLCPAASRCPYAERDGTDDEEDAQPLEPGRVVGLPQHHAADADGEHGEHGSGREKRLHVRIVARDGALPSVSQAVDPMGLRATG
jgi:hypothetical protein